MNDKTVGIWIRVSTEDQAQGESPKHHEERAKMYAELQGLEVKETYNLAGVSGKTVINHPEAQRMLYDIKRGHIKNLIFSKIARLARNTRELLEIADYFKLHNADLISLEESFSTSSPAGKLFFTFISAIAEWERAEIVSRINASVKVRAKMGKRLGGKVPFGYDWDGHDLILNEKEASIRKLIFTLFLKEKRKKTVARILNERGYTTRNGNKFYDTNVKRWLKDPLSKGIRRSNFTYKEIVDGKEVVKNKPKEEWFIHKAPRIVSDEIWQKANDILDEQEKSRTKPLNRKVHIFTKYIFCECNSTMRVTSGNQFYRCSAKGCSNKIEREQIENIFKEQLTDYVGLKERVQESIKSSDSFLNDKKRLLKTNEINKEKLTKKIESLIQLHIDGQIPKEAFKEYHDKPYNELQLVEKEIIKLESEIKIIKIQQDSIDMVMENATSLYNNWDSFNRIEKRRLVEMITKKITIFKDDRISIKLFRLLPQEPFLESKTNGQHNQ